MIEGSPENDSIELTVARAEQLTTIGRAEQARTMLVANPETPNHHGALIELARALDNMERYQESLETTQSAIRLEPDHPSGWLLNALALLHLDRPVEALPSARQSVALAPEYYGSHQILAQILAELGRFDEAYVHANKTLALTPGMTAGWVTLCRVQLAQQHWADAEQSARKALSIDPESDEARILLAVAQGSTGKTAKNNEALENLIALLRSNPDQQHVRALLIELVKPRRLPFPLWLTLPVIFLGGGAFVLLAWAAWVGISWFQTPADVRKLVLADRSARWRIGLTLVVAAVLIIGFVALTVIVGLQELANSSSGA